MVCKLDCTDILIVDLADLPVSLDVDTLRQLIDNTTERILESVVLETVVARSPALALSDKLLDAEEMDVGAVALCV